MDVNRSVTRLLLIRHAHVDTGASAGRLCGWLDLPLSAKGHAQLETLHDRPLVRERPDALYTSTLGRAREVASVLADMWQLGVHPVEALREIHCGRLDGMILEEIRREYPELWARNRSQQDDDFTWPEGESYREFRQRVLTALSGIAARHRGERVAVVTHAGVIAQVLGVLKGRPAAVWEHDRPSPLTVTEVTWIDGAPAAVLRFNARD